MDVSDQRLAAYVDNELQPDERRAMETAAAQDEGLAARLAAHARLRSRVGGAFADIADEPVPERLVRVATTGEGEVSSVVAFKPRPSLSQVPWTWASGGALAAGLALGVFLAPALQRSAGPSLIGPDMAARGVLSQALNTELASQPTSGPVRIGVTFRSVDGGLCRTFDARRGGVAGLACHGSSADWTVRMALAAPAAETGAYRTAASRLPQPVADLAQALQAGQPLNAQDEAKARANGWR